MVASWNAVQVYDIPVGMSALQQKNRSSMRQYLRKIFDQRYTVSTINIIGDIMAKVTISSCHFPPMLINFCRIDLDDWQRWWTLHKVSDTYRLYMFSRLTHTFLLILSGFHPVLLGRYSSISFNMAVYDCVYQNTNKRTSRVWDKVNLWTTVQVISFS